MDPGVATVLVGLISAAANVAIAVITTRAKQREGPTPVQRRSAFQPWGRGQRAVAVTMLIVSGLASLFFTFLSFMGLKNAPASKSPLVFVLIVIAAILWIAFAWSLKRIRSRAPPQSN